MNPDVDQIRARQKHITDEIAKLQKEADEIGVALRVIERYGGKAPDDGAETEEKDLPPRPPGIPSTYEMVVAILGKAETAGKREGLTSRELMDGIRAEYWPGVQNKQILPSIFGFGKKKRIIRRGDKWKKKPESESGLFKEQK